MGEPGGDADLAEEALGAHRGGELRVDHLEGDGPVVPEVVGEVDGGGAAAAEQGELPSGRRSILYRSARAAARRSCIDTGSGG